MTSLARKYRPKTLDEIRGNAGTVSALRAALKSDNPPHAMLFTGPTGCGKTTLARIAARGVGVKRLDFHEQNAADFRGIDSVRDVLRQARLAPMWGERSAWLFDEAHQLSKDAQAALLKALEEPPAHVHFMLATTDPEKLLPTVRNRCAQYTLVPLPEKELAALLSDVRKAEGLHVPDAVLELIVDEALGSARAALTVLDKVGRMPEREQAAEAQRVAAQQHEAIALCRALLRKAKWREVAGILKGLSAEDPEQVRRLVLGYCQSVLLGGDNGRAYLIASAFRDPFYDTGRPGLVLACYEATNG